MRIKLTSIILLIVTFVILGCSEAKEETNQTTGRIKMATTTSTENSGLLDVLLPAFKEESGIEVSVIAVGTGKALKLGENGDVDVVFVHSRQAEEDFVAQGFGVNCCEVMYNDFVIVGPRDNPARVKENEPVSEALKKIVQTSSAFVSRGDESGTHKKEKELWSRLGGRIKPGGTWYLETGQGMVATLMIADEKQAYCLIDRATYIAYRTKISLPILCQGDSNLFNPYGIIAVNPAKHPHIKYEEAMTFIKWITSPEGQKIIKDFKKDGEVLFYPNAEGNKQ